MKIKNIIGTLATVVLAMGVSSVVYAADVVALGTPVDFETGEAADLTEGELIAVPIEVTSSTGSIKSFGVDFSFDSNYFTYGVDEAAEDNMSEVIDGITLYKKDDDTSGILGGALGMYNKKGLIGSCITNEKSAGIATFQWAHSKSIATADQTEAYVFFTVVKDYDKLNTAPFVVTASDLGDTSSVVAEGEQEEANKCAAAFKLSFEPSEMEYYIHGLSIKVNGGEAKAITDYVENGTKIEFPVRLVGDATSVEVEITASTGATESAADGTTVLYSGTLALNPTDYVAVN